MTTTTRILRRKSLISFIAATLVGTVASHVAMAQAPRSFLFYGNSFTIGIGSTEAEAFGGVPEVVKQLAIAAGYAAPRVENAAVSGQSLDWHLANSTGAIANPGDFVELPDFQWDAVILQEFSTEPTHIGNPANFRADAVTLLGLVRSHSPSVQGVLFETWARGPGHEFYTGGSPAFPGGPAQMQQELRENYELARQDLVAAYGEDAAITARVGDAWEATGWDNLHSADIYHANTRGTYLTGLVIFGTIYGEQTTVGLPKLFASLSESEATALQAIADQYLPRGTSFDANGDGAINGDDLDGFAGCLSGPALSYPPTDVCPLMDGNEDEDVDLLDYSMMQTAAFEPTPTLNFATWEYTLNLETGGGIESESNTVTTSDGATIAVTLTADDLLMPGTPTWVTVPATVDAGVPFAVEVDPAGLSPGTYFARVYAAATGYEGSSFAITLNVTDPVGEQTIFVDFGDNAQQTPGNYNNITPTVGLVENAIDSGGIATGVSFTVTDAFWPGSNQNGTMTPTGDAATFDPQATRDNLFGNTVVFGGFTEPTGAVTLAGLSSDPGVSYTFTFFAARLGVGDNRETAYNIVGGNSGVGYLNTSNNTTQVAVVANITPDANGQIVVNVGPGPNNNNASGFYYIGAMKVVRNVP